MNIPLYIKQTNRPSQPLIINYENKNLLERDVSIVTDESSTYDNDKNLKAAMGIIWATICCIPFWLLFLKFIGWLLQLF